MVNKCPYCTVMALGVVGITVATYLYYGIGAVMFLWSAIVLVVGIAFHAILRIRKEELENEIRIKSEWMIANLGGPTPALPKCARLEE